MKKDINRCMGCMSEKQYSGPCEVCGYIDNNAYPPECLAPRTFLADRYVIGKLISKDGEGAEYLAFDTKLGQTVEIEEFIPDTLCKRSEDGESVVVIDGALPLFKSYLSEFADLHKMMMTGIDAGGLKKTFDIFAANGTGYVVTEHIEGITLSEYLSEKGDVLSWPEASAMLTPLLGTVAALHKKGIIHRGISPDTVLITKDRKAILTSIEISAARTAESRLSSEMYGGYAAIEQYDLSERQGNWTDVYGMSALLYRVLTGITPPDAPARRSDDTLPPAKVVNRDVPAYVSDAVAAGMKTARSERLHDIQTLKAMLSDVPSGASETDEPDNDGPITPNVHVKFDIDEHEEHLIKAEKNKRRKKEQRKNVGAAIGFIVFIALVAALVICIIYFSNEAQNINKNPVTAQTEETVETEEPEATTPKLTAATTEPVAVVTESTAEKLMMPDFVNRFYNSTLQSRYSMLEFEVEEDYSDEFAEGIIMEQDIPKDTQVTAGTVVHIKVSKGAAYTFLPDYIGMKLSKYKEKLTTLGIRFETVPEETSEVKSGYVVRCSKEVDEKVLISEDEVITVYYAVKPTKETTVTEEEIPITDPDNFNGDNDGEEIIN